jgi:hypothetical protein
MTSTPAGASTALLGAGSRGRVIASSASFSLQARTRIEAVRRRPSVSRPRSLLRRGCSDLPRRHPRDRLDEQQRRRGTSQTAARPGIPQVDAPRRGRRRGRGAALPGEAATTTGGCEVPAQSRTVAPRASGRPTRRLIEAALSGLGGTLVLSPRSKSLGRVEARLLAPAREREQKRGGPRQQRLADSPNRSGPAVSGGPSGAMESAACSPKGHSRPGRRRRAAARMESAPQLARPWRRVENLS